MTVSTKAYLGKYQIEVERVRCIGWIGGAAYVCVEGVNKPIACEEATAIRELGYLGWRPPQ